MDILGAIDAAVGCQACGGPLGKSPSDDFCRPECQDAWHAGHGDKLVGYREPWDIGDLPGIGRDVYEMAEWRLPRETADLNADMRALGRAYAAAVTPEQRAACAVRAASLLTRTAADRAERARVAAEALAQVGSALGQALQGVGEAFRRFGEALRPAAAAWQKLTNTAPAPADPRERALHARRHRNTGPPVRHRPPRQLGRPRSMGRRGG